MNPSRGCCPDSIQRITDTDPAARRPVHPFSLGLHLLVLIITARASLRRGLGPLGPAPPEPSSSSAVSHFPSWAPRVMLRTQRRGGGNGSRSGRGLHESSTARRSLQQHLASYAHPRRDPTKAAYFTDSVGPCDLVTSLSLSLRACAGAGACSSLLLSPREPRWLNGLISQPPLPPPTAYRVPPTGLHLHAAALSGGGGGRRRRRHHGARRGRGRAGRHAGPGAALERPGPAHLPRLRVRRGVRGGRRIRGDLRVRLHLLLRPAHGRRRRRRRCGWPRRGRLALSRRPGDQLQDLPLAWPALEPRGRRRRQFH